MIRQTKGIVIRGYKYSDSSLIAHIYTKDFGLLSFIVPGARSKKAKIKASYFQHLTLVDLEIYYRSTRQLQKIKELAVNPVFQSIPYEIAKTSIAMFMAEVLNKTLQEEAGNEALFEYLWDLIVILDEWETGLSNFPLGFLAGMAGHWGIQPQNDYDQNRKPYFNLQEGCFQESQPEEAFCLAYPESHYLSQLMNLELHQINEFNIPATARHELLNKMLDYCRLHLAHFSRIKSIGILNEVLR